MFVGPPEGQQPGEMKAREEPEKSRIDHRSNQPTRIDAVSLMWSQAVGCQKHAFSKLLEHSLCFSLENISVGKTIHRVFLEKHEERMIIPLTSIPVS